MIDSIPGNLASGSTAGGAIDEPAEDVARCSCDADAPGDGPTADSATDPAAAIVAVGSDYVDSLVDAGVLTTGQGAAAADDTELLLTIGALVGDGSDTVSLGVADDLVETSLAEYAAPTDEADSPFSIGSLLAEAGVPPELVRVLTGDAAGGATSPDGTGDVRTPSPELARGAPSDADGTASGMTPAQIAALQQAAVAGRSFVDGLVDAGSLSPERASQLLAGDDFASRVGLLTADGSAEGTRAAEVLITDVGTSAGPADRHLSALARSGDIDLDAFKALVNDGDLLASLLPHLTPAADGEGAPDPATADLMIDQAIGNLAAGRPADAGAGEVFESRDGLLFRAAGVPDAPQVSGAGPDGEPIDPAAAADALAENALERPAYVLGNGQPFPPELQGRLDAAAATPEGLDPYTLDAARLLTTASTGQGSPSELFVAQSFLGGQSDLDTFLAQANDPAFLEDPGTARAADMLFGGGSGRYAGAEQFTNSLFSEGHIGQEAFIEHANDAAFLADVQTQIDSGTVTYTSENFGEADALLEMDDAQIRELLGPGFDINEGPPSAEQIAALSNVAGRDEQVFTELAVAWVTEHNPGLELRYGHPDPAVGGEVREYFWEKDGETIEDPFLDSLVDDLAFEDGSKVDKKFHKARRNADDDGEPMPPSIHVQLHMEGVSGNRSKEGSNGGGWASRSERSQEKSDESERAFSLVFPDKDIDDVLDRQGGYSVHIDDNRAEGSEGGIDGKARRAMEIVDPDLFGVQVTWTDDVDGLQITNSTRFDDTVVRANDAGDLDVQTTDNAGDLDVVISGDTQFEGEGGSGFESIQSTENGVSAVGNVFDPVGANAVPDTARRDALIGEALTSGLFVTPGGSFDFQAFGTALDGQSGLSVDDRQYIFQQVSGAVNAQADATAA